MYAASTIGYYVLFQHKNSWGVDVTQGASGAGRQLLAVHSLQMSGVGVVPSQNRSRYPMQNAPGVSQKTFDRISQTCFRQELV